MAVTFFADLGHTKDHISDIDHHSYRKRTEINAFYHQVFPESTIFYLSPPFIKLLYLIVRQKTYLTVPFTGMCISFNTKIFQKMSTPFFSLVQTAFTTPSGPLFPVISILSYPPIEIIL